MARQFRSLDLNLLRVFDAVMAERNLTRAAISLSMTQPAVSNALRRLREALGDDLVVRAGYGVQPTPQAQMLWPTVRGALAQLQEALAPTPFDARAANNTFVLAMADATAAALVPPLIRRVETTAPGVSIRVMPLTTRDPRALLESGEADLAVGYFPSVLAAIAQRTMQDAEPDVLAHQRLYDGRYVCALRRGHRLLQEPLSLDAYCAAHHVLVSFSGKPYGFVDEALAGLKRTRRIVLTVNQFFTAARVVSESDLLTVLPHHFLRSTGIADQLTTVTLPFDIDHVHVELLWHRLRDDRAGYAWLRQLVGEAARLAFHSPGDGPVLHDDIELRTPSTPGVISESG
ncbi:MAG: LysR family transcriptional regulator [Burkholderiaceae bacterium]